MTTLSTNRDRVNSSRFGLLFDTNNELRIGKIGLSTVRLGNKAPIKQVTALDKITGAGGVKLLIKLLFICKWRN